MTSTHIFQGLESDNKTSSRVLKPPGGGSSSIFGGSDEPAVPNKPHKMASNIFDSPAETQNAPKRSNPPGGKTSGIFQDSTPAQTATKTNPPGGKGSDIFGNSLPQTSPKAHPNKPKDNMVLNASTNSTNSTPVKADAPAAVPKEEKTPVAKEEKIPVSKEEKTPVVPVAKEEKTPVAKKEKTPIAKEEKVAVPDPALAAHEPHLGPKPRSHNRVLNPPGGKSSITFY
ncbi:jupiter microtubule associated homolog 2 [Bombina bombina]|uniref:jupiter microtubule associated homolog 2 n=1 Tax=Bombina bombina TaxID=8345 RepID=UPI00235AD296|nr:jupiter microtubule associated homolog 2 [Bombina bombina]